MKRKFLISIILSLIFSPIATQGIELDASKILSNVKNSVSRTKDPRTEELKYQYKVLKEDEKNKYQKKVLNREPSGYMTVQEYEKMSEYKGRAETESKIPQIETPSDFKYIPHPIYSIVKYNDPPGTAELSLGKRLFVKRQINAQGIVSPDYSILVYPAVYYYPDSASVACDLFIIPLDAGDTNLNRILKANVAKRIPTPILSTDKKIDNYAVFRTLTPVDFSPDGSKILVKEKIGSSEDGIWKTNVHVYDFNKLTSYNLVEVRDAIVYFWKEYMNVDLDNNRWDIFPLGFDEKDPSRIVVQAYAYTGERPVYLGAWSIDIHGNQSRLISFRKEFIPKISSNGFKIIKDGVETYETVQREEKNLLKETANLKKAKVKENKKELKMLKDEYKFNLKILNNQCKEELGDYKMLQKQSGNLESVDIEEALKKYQKEQLEKNIQNLEKQIEKIQIDIDKLDEKINILKGIEPNSSEIQDDSDEKLEQEIQEEIKKQNNNRPKVT